MKFQSTGEVRVPEQGEYFLSHSIVVRASRSVLMLRNLIPGSDFNARVIMEPVPDSPADGCTRVQKVSRD